MSINDINYAQDSRTQGLRRPPVIEDDQGVEIQFPLHWVLCPVCRGEGSHVNPSIDCNGLTAEDFDQDADFQEEYMNGAYDVTCNGCAGRTTVQEVDRERCTPEQLRALDEYQRGEAEDRALRMAELRMGA